MQKWESEIRNYPFRMTPVHLRILFLRQGNPQIMVFTTGGTGIGPRDITVETVKPLLDKEIPGIMEFIRMKYGAEMPNALLSRGIAGVFG